jgi:hypothetical protein
MIDRKKQVEKAKRDLFRNKGLDKANEKLFLNLCNVFVKENENPLVVLDTLNVVRMYVVDTILKNAIEKDERRLKRNWK